MFRSVKLKNVPLTVFSLVCLVLFVAVCLLMLRAGAPDTVTIGGEAYSLRAEDEDDLTAFLPVCGYSAGELLSERDVVIPKIWNDTYIRYNKLQRMQGFDLVPYKGKPARETVRQDADSGAVITLLTADGKIIAGHISSADGSEMHPLIE